MDTSVLIIGDGAGLIVLPDESTSDNRTKIGLGDELESRVSETARVPCTVNGVPTRLLPLQPMKKIAKNMSILDKAFLGKR